MSSSRKESGSSLLDTGRGLLPKEARARKCLMLSLAALLVFLAVLGIWSHHASISDALGREGEDAILMTLPPANLDTSYSPKRSFDIVVSHYSESLPELRATLAAITSLPSLASKKPNIIVYTKHATTPLSSIASALHLPEANIRRLPNRGREGGTYLTHLLTNWDDLAAHTLFMQAHVHNEFYLLQRLHDYFAANTGYLSFGFSGKSCPLTECVDEWGWRDRYHQLPSIYTLLFGRLPPPGRFTLSYKGQFIVSAQRARGVSKEKLQILQNVLEAPESPYSRNVVEDGEVEQQQQGRDAPRFGFVLERAWGLVFACADGKLAETCPSLWRQRREGEALADCQCLDS